MRRSRDQRSPFLATDEFWWRRAPGAEQIELSVAAAMYMGAQPIQWRERRAVDWDELREWRYLTALWSSLVKQLRERIDCTSIHCVKPLYQQDVMEEAIHQSAQPLLG